MTTTTAEEPAKKLDSVTVRKVEGGPTEGQLCTGCGKWQPLDAYGRTSKPEATVR